MIFKSRTLIFASQIRNYSTQEVRVRFAPSPTGYLHLGGLRTALYNYLFAKQRNGKFILRIEDTDRTRIISDATAKLKDDLQWAGINLDEGPNIGGDYGPYIQSERLHIYKEYVKQLLDNDSAYYCFCNDKRLDLLRKEAIKTRQVPKYDNRCRNLTKTDVQMRKNIGESYCIRFKLTPNNEPFYDLIYGNILYDVARNEGDPVIMKKDEYPTYHFANVIDDHLMNITHVLRGVEWQISTPKHLLLYKAFDWKPPEFGHLPLIMNADGTKLSKRQGDIQVEQFKKNGIFPQALINYVISCGGGFDTEPGISEAYSMDDLFEKFDIDRMNSHSSKLNPDKLLELNRLELKKLLNNETTCRALIGTVQDLIAREFPQQNLNLNDDYVKSILKWSETRITKVPDLISKDLMFLWIMPSNEIQFNKNEMDILKSLASQLKRESLHFEKDEIKEFLSEFAEQQNLAKHQLMKMMRTILSGLKEGPGVAEMMEILGRDNTLSRISRFTKKPNAEIQ